MFQGPLYAWKLWRLKAHKKAIRRRYSKLLVGVEPKSDSYNELVHSEMLEKDYANDEIAQLRSQRLVQLADEYLIALPPNFFRGNLSENWARSEITGKLQMLPNVQEQVRQAIRDEQRYRWEAWSRWVPILFGLIGALTGLVAMFRHP